MVKRTKKQSTYSKQSTKNDWSDIHFESKKDKAKYTRKQKHKSKYDY